MSGAQAVSQPVWLYVMRQAVRAEHWPQDRIHVAWDVARAADENGGDALRSVFHAMELGITKRTAERYRQALTDAGWLLLQSKGGNGRAANVYKLTVPPSWAHRLPEATECLERVRRERHRPGP